MIDEVEAVLESLCAWLETEGIAAIYSKVWKQIHIVDVTGSVIVAIIRMSYGGDGPWLSIKNDSVSSLMPFGNAPYTNQSISLFEPDAFEKVAKSLKISLKFNRK